LGCKKQAQKQSKKQPPFSHKAGVTVRATGSEASVAKRKLRANGEKRRPPRPLIVSTDGLATITWSSVAGKTYRPHYKSNLTAESWQDSSPDVTASGSTTAATDAVGTSSEGNYCVFVVE